MIYTLLITLFFQSNSLPAWFYKTPENTIVVVVRDSHTRKGRTISLFKEANRMIAMENNQVQVNGNNGFFKRNSTSQKDKIEIVYNIENEFDRSNLENKNYVLLDYERYNEKYILALFGNENVLFNKERIVIENEPEWINSTSNTKLTATGFGSNNEIIYSNWIEAFNHALFNIAHAKSVYTYQQLRNQKSDNSKSFSKVSINFVDARFNGLRIINRWIDPRTQKMYMKLEEVAYD